MVYKYIMILMKNTINSGTFKIKQIFWISNSSTSAVGPLSSYINQWKQFQVYTKDQFSNSGKKPSSSSDGGSGSEAAETRQGEAAAEGTEEGKSDKPVLVDVWANATAVHGEKSSKGCVIEETLKKNVPYHVIMIPRSKSRLWITSFEHAFFFQVSYAKKDKTCDFNINIFLTF